MSLAPVAPAQMRFFGLFWSVALAKSFGSAVGYHYHACFDHRLNHSGSLFCELT